MHVCIRLIFASLLAAFLALGMVSKAVACDQWGTPDSCTPSREDVCIHWKNFSDSGNDKGNGPYGLCVAYCEAQDCDTHNEGKKSCMQLRENLKKLTGTWDFACGEQD